MTALLWNVLLALSWTTLTGHVTPANLLVGFALGYVVLLVAKPVVGSESYFRKVPQAARFALFLAWEVVLSSLRVAHDVLTPRHHMRPGVIAIPLDAQTDAEIAFLANLITLTPGTLSLDVSADRRVLYIHAMYVDEEDLDLFRARVKHGYERRVLEFLR